jgi:hypothetical protein
MNPSTYCQTWNQLEQHLRRVNANNVNSGIKYVDIRQDDCRQLFKLCEKLGVKCSIAVYKND